MKEGWRSNLRDEKPPQHVWVRIRLTSGEEVIAFYVKDINKYVRGIRRWKNVETGKWYDDSEVAEWKPFTEECEASV